jgi:type I restriction-modification system DNA methylase subunit
VARGKGKEMQDRLTKLVTIFNDLPTCGSGSLLLKVAAEAPRGITIYGQEKDNATWALSKMNCPR